MHVTAEDMNRLREIVDRYVDGRLAAVAEELELELDGASVVDVADLPPDTVTMRSRFVLEDVETGRRREATLVYPNEADPQHGRFSVLTPAGLALLGLRAGEVVEWPTPTGRTTSMRIVEVLYQPEAAGDLHL